MSRDRVFVNHRTDDGHQGEPELLFQALAQRLGKERVFYDARGGISAGDPIDEKIQEALERTAVFVCMIGAAWNKLHDEHGVRPIDKAGDYVRFELEYALSHGVEVVVLPVLCGGQKNWPAKEWRLQGDLAKLVGIHGLEIRSNDREEHRRRVVEAILARLPSAVAESPWQRYVKGVR